MLHSLLVILKIAGILLLTLLCLLLFLLLVVLFVPIRYRIKLNKDDQDFAGTLKASWLLGCVRFSMIYKEKQTDKKLRLLGIDILNQKRKRKKSVSKAGSADNIKRKEDTNTKPMELTEGSTENKEDAKCKKTDAQNKKVIERIKKIRLTIKNIYDKIKYWKDFLSDKRTKEAIRLLKKHIIKLLKHIMPGKIDGTVLLGFEDPCTTGQVLAGLSVVYPVYGKYLCLTPDFSGAVFQGNVDMEGRVYGFYLLKSILAIIFDKNLQHVIHVFRSKEET